MSRPLAAIGTSGRTVWRTRHDTPALTVQVGEVSVGTIELTVTTVPDVPDRIVTTMPNWRLLETGWEARIDRGWVGARASGDITILS